jgi:hypothetical protein
MAPSLHSTTSQSLVYNGAILPAPEPILTADFAA